MISKLLDVPVALLVEHNTARYPGISASSKLKRDTWYGNFFCPAVLAVLASRNSDIHGCLIEFLSIVA